MKKIVLVTGAASGIGRAIALRLARAHYPVVAAVRDLDNAGELKTILETERLEAVTLGIDVTDDESVRAGVEEACRRLGRIDVLVNNAGISISDPLETGPMEIARRVFEVNYFGALRMTKAVLPGMRERQGGVVVNIGSISAQVPTPCLAHYSASKAALAAASEALAQEVSRFGIRVAVLEPGVVSDTNMFTRRTHLRPIDPDSPYLDDIASLYALFRNSGTISADDVAKLVEGIIEGVVPGLRHVVGPAAESLAEVRRSVSDEEWVRTSRRLLGGSE